MNSMELVRFPTGRPRLPQVAPKGPKKSAPPRSEELIAPARNAIVRARHSLITRQRPDGAWLGRQPVDVALASQLVLMLAYADREETELAEQCAATILAEQRPDGGWSSRSNGLSDISASVQAYFALKIMGQDPTDEHMRAARSRIRALGGTEAADETSRYYLALFGQVDYDRCQPLPPEAKIFGRTESSLRVPLSIIWTLRPVREMPIESGVRELFVQNELDSPATSVWERAGTVVRRVRKLRTSICQYRQRQGWPARRHQGLNRAKLRLLQHIEPNEISSLNFSALLWHIVALHTIGCDADSPELNVCEDQLRELVDTDYERDQACPRLRSGASADTSMAIHALAESGLTSANSAIQDGLDALCESMASAASVSTVEECNRVAALSRCIETVVDVVDSVLPPEMDVRWDWRYACGSPEQDGVEKTVAIEHDISSSIARLLSAQKRDGGWCSISEPQSRAQVSEVEATAAALETLASCSAPNRRAAIDRGARYLRSQQLSDGSWSASDGTQKVSCTSAAIRGLIAAGMKADDDCIAAATNWLIVERQSEGGWNDCAVQTSLAILALVAAGKSDHGSVAYGVGYLAKAQNADGGWSGEPVSARDAEIGRSLPDELDGICWPLLALSRFVVAASSAQSSGAALRSLQLVGAASDI